METIKSHLAEILNQTQADGITVFRVVGDQKEILAQEGSWQDDKEVSTLCLEKFRPVSVKSRGKELVFVGIEGGGTSPLTVVGLAFKSSGPKGSGRRHQAALWAAQQIALLLQHDWEKEAILRSLPIPAFWTDPQGRIIAVTNAAAADFPALQGICGQFVDAVWKEMPFSIGTSAVDKNTAMNGRFREESLPLRVTVIPNGLRLWHLVRSGDVQKDASIYQRIRLLTKILSHVVNNSLQVLIANAEMAAEALPKESEWENRLSSAFSAINQMKEAIEALTRLSRSWQEQTTGSVPLAAAAEEALGLLKRKGLTKQVENQRLDRKVVVFGYFGEIKEIFYQVLRQVIEKWERAVGLRLGIRVQGESAVAEITPIWGSVPAAPCGPLAPRPLSDQEGDLVENLGLMIAKTLLNEMGGKLLVLMSEDRCLGIQLKWPAIATK
ncbi:MAG: hypothetical protein NZ959_00340 [Armatimonadetes bacterium]|nr:hypothetical protein [Armatimonadota bacterium]MDW8120762.1 hypothetical protein [Armatimonadota bacterium]